MHIILGLGNPGSEYEGTRHNIGFSVIDTLADQLNVPLRSGKDEYIVGFAKVNNISLALAKPLTYMNNSGLALLDIAERYSVEINNLLVVVDDYNLPLGKLRLRTKGSDGGHNGLYSIIYHLQSNEFPRLRIGIASDSMPKEKDQLADFVLSKFEPNERESVNDVVQRASKAALAAVTESLQTAMNRFNI